MTCIVKVDQTEIDVEKLYREHGFVTLPPQLTIMGADLRRHGNVALCYGIYRADDIQHGIADMQAVPVADGDRFCSVPPATSGQTQ